MEKIKRFYDICYQDRICNEFDQILPIVGDEGMGKSTFIIESMLIWQDIRDGERNKQEIFNNLAYTRDDLKQLMVDLPPRSVIAVPDAARVLHKKDAMHGDQKEAEKDFFDVRTKEFLILLGYQYWKTIPTFLQERRAKNLFYIPRRGLIRGYNRTSLDKKLNDMEPAEWPAADLRDTFPSLEGTDIWAEYKTIDKQKKNERMNGQDNHLDHERELTIDEIVDSIQSSNIQDYVSVHTQNNRAYIDPDLIEYEFDISARKANKVRKLLSRDIDQETLRELSAA